MKVNQVLLECVVRACLVGYFGDFGEISQDSGLLVELLRIWLRLDPRADRRARSAQRLAEFARLWAGSGQFRTLAEL